MKSHAFRHGRSENRDECHKTIKAIAQHAAEECDHSRDIKMLLKKLKCEATVAPTDTDWDNATAMQKLTQKKHADICMLCEV